jgi:Holliday junction resolvase
MNINYKRGVALEYKVKQLYEELGYFVVRSAGSHSIADLVAIDHGMVYLVQCKAEPLKKIKKEEVLKLIETCKKYGATPVLVYKEKHKIRAVEREENILGVFDYFIEKK